MQYFMRNYSGCFETTTADCTILMISPKKVIFLYWDVCVKEIDLIVVMQLKFFGKWQLVLAQCGILLHFLGMSSTESWALLFFRHRRFYSVNQRFSKLCGYKRQLLNWNTDKMSLSSRMVSLNSSLTNWNQLQIFFNRNSDSQIHWISRCFYYFALVLGTIVSTGGQIEEVRWTKGIRSIYWLYEFLMPKRSRISAKLSRNQMAIEPPVTNASLLTEHTKNRRIWKFLVFSFGYFWGQFWWVSWENPKIWQPNCTK